MDDGSGKRNDVYLLLVTANVLRLRGQYELAQAKCSEALQLEPENAAAYSVLGDVSRDQGRLRDAIEWYKMALDRAPGNVPDRRKLEAVIDQVYTGDRGQAARVRSAVASRVGPVVAELKGAWLPSSIGVPLAVLLAVIVVVTVAVLAIGGADGPRARVPETPSGAFVEVEEGGKRAGATAEPPAPPEPRFGEDVGPLEAALLAELRERAEAMDPDCRVLEVQVDPVSGTAGVRVSMVRFWSPADTRERMLAAAAALGAAAAAADERIAAVRVRSEMRQRNMPERLAMVGEGPAEAFLRAAEGTPQSAEKLFTSIWWHPDLRPAEGSGPAGEQ
jgi:hypothetical protein